MGFDKWLLKHGGPGRVGKRIVKEFVYQKRMNPQAFKQDLLRDTLIMLTANRIESGPNFGNRIREIIKSLGSHSRLLDLILDLVLEDEGYFDCAKKDPELFRTLVEIWTEIIEECAPGE